MSGESNTPQDVRPISARLLDCDAYLFDIDGTLMNVRDATHYHAFHNAVRKVYGVDSQIDGVPVHGNTDLGILRAVVRRAGVSDAEFEAQLPAAIEHMCSEVTRNAAAIRPELCPSIAELLHSLSKANKLLGIVTGNLETIGWLKLQAAGIREYFGFGSFSDTAELRTTIFQNAIRHVQLRIGGAASICVIGDTPSDIVAGREAGVAVIAVATGIFSSQELAMHAPDAVVSCCTELLPILHRRSLSPSGSKQYP